MAGVYGIFLKDKTKGTSVKVFSEDLIEEKEEFNSGVLGRYSIPKLKKDRFFETINRVSICFEGVNLSETLIQKKDFFNAYKENGISFLKELKGSYSGFVFDETTGKVYVFTDHLSTKSIFYYFHKEIGFLFASDLKTLSVFLRQQKLSYNLNRDAIYMMSLYGFLLEDNTYVKEVKRLGYSSIVIYDTNTSDLRIEKKHQYSSTSKKIPYDLAIDEINSLMEYSVRRDWEKDLQYAQKHISFLSGGMDARTNIIVAKDLGFDNISTITFGQSNSKDLLYAKSIAKGEGLHHHERLLDSPQYLIDNIFENYIVPNDGLIMFHSSAHSSSTVKNMDLTKFATIHTGQIGDVLFGSFSKERYDFFKNRGAIGYTGFVSDDRLLDKIETLPNILEKYQSLGIELYIYEQRQINATIMGDRSLNNVIDNLSPFYNQELIDYCLSLPHEFKKNQKIYFDWLKKHHKRAIKYSWDKINMAPNHKFKIIYGKQIKRYINGGKKYFGLKYDSMNPYNQWLKEDKTIIATLDSILNEEIEKNYLDLELKQDLKAIYEKNIFEFRNKFAVVTALLAIKLHFGDLSDLNMA
jgi:asparagine synthase (glutamine-hydrolysing)